MRYVGIDIAKKDHQIAAVDEFGNVILKSFSAGNNESGFAKIAEKLEAARIESDECLVGMEATGHYWISLWEFLDANGYEVVVINPIQTDAFRKVDSLRKTKTDAIDSVLIAEYLRFANPESSKMANPDVEQLRELARFRSFLVEQATQLKNKAIRVLDQAFPEYGKLFSNTFGEASKALLKQCPTPEEVLATDIRTLTRILKENSGGNCGRAKAEAVKVAARSSIGAKFGARALSFEIKLLVKRLSFTQVQIEELEDEISELLHRSDGHWLTTIPGIGDSLAASIAGEIGDPDRFETPKKLIAYAGMDASKYQSGANQDTNGHMSKRGSSELRRALMLAADKVRIYDPYFGEYYDSMKARGKHHYVALSGVARKLAGVCLSLMREQRPYESEPPEHHLPGHLQRQA